MDGVNAGDSKETGAGSGDLSQTDVIDYAKLRPKNGAGIDPPAVSSKSRKKRKVQSDGAGHARDIKEGGDEGEESSGDEYKHKVAHAMKENKKRLDLDEVNARLEEKTRVDDTSSEGVEGNNLFPHGAAVPSGAACLAPSSSGEKEKMPSLMERRKKVHWKLSPTLVNDKSVFNWGRDVSDPTSENEMDDQVDTNHESNSNSGSDAAGDANNTTTTGDVEMKVPAANSTGLESMPSSVLEKGIIYFFSRPTVRVADQAQGVEGVARSFFVLRPLLLGAHMGKAPLQDKKDARLLHLPMGTWPQSMQDKFLCLVDKAGFGIAELKARLAGPSHLAPVAPVAEGIYAIASTDRASHLAYHITHPRISAVHAELGLGQKGSFVCLVKNPTAPDQTVYNLAKYPEKLQKRFRNLRWTSLVPEHLNYEGTQLLLIGVGKSVDDEKNGKIGLEDEMDRLEREDHERVEGLKEDDPIFADLGLDAQEYSHMQTTW
ncbi:hypothetical protein DSL72_003163 [Monilinia vaccinii-corymbosi]|uniref:Uncharacterized protein n=1 Tax=Monilinia vaccinii-corymbosi TaxID=61207 RepID=A0A8A3NZ09_9HELO|nr:hypothetical protein DSL72_003163 [Monilinia vaccinii-corymbosi]